ncbi:hypothetical protein [Nocardioides sp. LML1-1-1.1]|uniref:hypothetical protein n=1 Tax=Nocardioides sp. LML1-1-1.1 TaxID=3135248 RepID=UPI00343F0C51
MTTSVLTRPRVRVAAVLLVLAVGIAGVLVWRLGEDPVAPYDDARSSGRITLCLAGERVTGGKLDERPFADVVLGSTGLPEGTDPSGAVATLFAYQPREGVGPEEFSGSPITAAVAFADPARPATRVTKEAWTLQDFVTAFPADLDGYVQLRLVLGTPAGGTLADHYDTADVRVDGDSWELVGGGDASCVDAGKAVSGS